MDLVSLVEVGQMHFDGRKGNRPDYVVKRHAREAKPRGIDDGAINIVDVRLERVD